MKATPIFRPVPAPPRRMAAEDVRRARREQASQQLKAATERVKRVIVAIGIDPHHVYGGNKHPNTVLIRGAICAVLRYEHRMPLPAIAYALGRSSHSTIIDMLERWDASPKEQPLGEREQMGRVRGMTRRQVYFMVRDTMEEVRAKT